jgi:hypothetical protein
MTDPGAEAPDVPRLGDWIGLTLASTMLGVSRQALWKKIFGKNPLLRTVHQIPSATPYYVVSEAEVLALKLRTEQLRDGLDKEDAVPDK